MANFVTILEMIETGAFAGEANAFFLGFDGDEFRAGQTPGGDHADGADAAAEVEHAFGERAPGSGIPGGEDVVGGKAMAFFELEKAKVAADGIERFAFFDAEIRDVRRLGAGLGPALENPFRVRCVQDAGDLFRKPRKKLA